MLNNPIQQIERTQDAYAGNPEGLQKRANMSKELIDLLAMQALQSDLAAQKRNMAMQQQGNPQTVKDQLEEGLMGEYRQKAAKDLGVGPSEGDVVERAGIAGQQMAQNAQVPQGPQGGGGVASQTGPVKLAGGGIVAFDAGGEVTDEYLQEKGIARDEFEAMSPQQQEQIRRLQRHDLEGLSGFLKGLLGGGKGGAGLEEFRRSQGFDTSLPATPSAVVSRDNATKLDMQEEERKGRAGTTPPAQEVDTTGIASLPKVTGPTLEQQGKAVTEREKQYTQQRKEEAAAASGIAAQSQNPYADQLAAALGQDALQLPEYEPSAELNTAIQKLYTERDPDAAAAKARELFRDTENREMNTEQLTRLDAMRERNVERRNPFTDSLELAAGLTKGLGGVGEASRSMKARRKQEEEAYETKRVAIQTARKNINETMGKEALASYDKAEEQNRDNKRAIVTALDGLDARKQKRLEENVKSQMTQRTQNISALVGLTQRQESILNRKAGEGLRTMQEFESATNAHLALTKAPLELRTSMETQAEQQLVPTAFQKRALGTKLEPEEIAALAAARASVLENPDYIAQVAAIDAAANKLNGIIAKFGTPSSTGGISSTSRAGAAINAKKDG